MIASQATLLQQLDKQQARGKLASQQYDALGMEGSRRRQIVRLLDERNNRDPRHEYQLASVTLNQRPVASDIMDIQSMRVILIQRPRQGVPADTLVDYPSLLTSEVVNLAYYDTTQRHRDVSTVGISGYTSNATRRPDSPTRSDSHSRSVDIPYSRPYRSSHESTTSRASKDSGYASMGGTSCQASISSAYYDPRDARGVRRPSLSPPDHTTDRSAPKPREGPYRSCLAIRSRWSREENPYGISITHLRKLETKEKTYRSSS